MYKLAILILLITSGCYQIHSDDDLRTVPTTNNPNLIKDSNAKVPGVGH